MLERVGKSSLILRYCRNVFDEEQASTVDVSYMDKIVHLDGSEGMSGSN